MPHPRDSQARVLYRDISLEEVPEQSGPDSRAVIIKAAVNGVERAAIWHIGGEWSLDRCVSGFRSWVYDTGLFPSE